MKLKTIGVLLWLAILCRPGLSEAQESGYPYFYPKEHFTAGRLALKTNLLGDVALLPNIGIEVPLGDHWSVQGSYFGVWMDNDPRHEYWRMYGGDLEGRYWLGEALLGHHFGLYAQVMTYDFEFGGRGMQGRKPHFGIGASYGWSYPVADRFTLDFNVGVGFVTGLYEEYVPCDGCYLWQNTKRLNYFGPTKAAISLVYHFK